MYISDLSYKGGAFERVVSKRASSLFNLMQAADAEEVDHANILNGQISGYLVFPSGGPQSRDYMVEILKNIPEPFLHALRDRRAGIVFDDSREGRGHKNDRATALHRVLHERNIDPTRVCYITQNRFHKEDYTTWAKDHHLNSTISVLNYDYHIKRFFQNSWENPRKQFEEKLYTFLNERKIERKYICLNYKPRPWRILLLAYLLKDDLWNDGFVSFGGLQNQGLGRAFKSNVWSKGGPLDQFLELRLSEQVKEYIPLLEQKGKVLFGIDDKNPPSTKDRTLDVLFEFFLKSSFSLVSETAMSTRPLRITEKPLKPLCNFHPLIVFGHCGSLGLIKELGFQTFGDWIDESYDSITNSTERFAAAYRSFLDFQKNSVESVLNSKPLQIRLAENVEHGMLHVPMLYRSKIDPAFCAELRRAVPLAEGIGPTTY